MTESDERRDALARVIDPEAWDLYDDKRMQKMKSGIRDQLVAESRALANNIIESGLMASYTWERREYIQARKRIIEDTSRTGKCYGVEDGLDGYCKHDPKCVSWPNGASGPNSSCIT